MKKSNNMDGFTVKDASYYEDLIAKLSKEYEDLEADSSKISREELIEKEKDLDRRLMEARDSYNDALGYECYVDSDLKSDNYTGSRKF